jgi:hypothetical protein
VAKRALGLEEIAAEVGRLFGTTEAHARRWLDQRNTLLEALSTVRDKANGLMSELGGVPSPFGKKKRGRPVSITTSPLNDTPSKRRGRRKISDATREKMRAAAQKRWADKKRAAGGTKRGSQTPKRTVTSGRTATK